jgi:hypothetical protein
VSAQLHDPAALFLGLAAHGTNFAGSFVVKASLDIMEKRKIPVPYKESKPVTQFSSS